MKKGEISCRAAADVLGCSRSTVHRLIERGDLVAYALSDPGWWRIERRSLDQYIKKVRNGRRRKR